MPKPDFVGDPSVAFLFLLKEAGVLPDYVTQVPEKEDLQGLPSVAFADSENRSFPVHDKQATYLSAVDAFVKGATHREDPWLARLKTACDAHGISSDVQKAHDVLEVKSASSESINEKEASDKQASPKFETHALELQVTPEGSPTKFYPIGSATQVAETALKIASDIQDQKLPLAWHSEACEKLLKSASRLGVDHKSLPKAVLEFGRQFTPSREVLEGEIQKRAAAGVSDDYTKIYKEAAELALAGEIEPNEGALVWQMADKKAGVDSIFSGQEDPVWAFKSGLPRDVVDKVKEAHCMVGNVVIHKKFLDQVSDREIISRCATEDANFAYKAKQASSGTEATVQLGNLSADGVEKISAMILKVVSVNGLG